MSEYLRVGNQQLHNPCSGLFLEGASTRRLRPEETSWTQEHWKKEERAPPGLGILSGGRQTFRMLTPALRPGHALALQPGGSGSLSSQWLDGEVVPQAWNGRLR